MGRLSEDWTTVGFGGYVAHHGAGTLVSGRRQSGVINAVVTALRNLGSVN